jgi:Ca2+-binding EF-hand superfamily protein
MLACRFAAAALLSLLAVACAGRPERPAAPRPVYSPLGEYLVTPRGTSCTDALQRWFDRVDSNRDGRFDATERQAEAARLFAAFDADRDGFVTPQELLAARRAAAPAAAEPPPESAAPRRRGRNIDTSPDPVMAADLNLDFRVSRTEFDQHVERRLQAADTGRHGYLSKADLPALCA